MARYLRFNIHETSTLRVHQSAAREMVPDLSVSRSLWNEGGEKHDLAGPSDAFDRDERGALRSDEPPSDGELSIGASPGSSSRPRGDVAFHPEAPAPSLAKSPVALHS